SPRSATRTWRGTASGSAPGRWTDPMARRTRERGFPTDPEPLPVPVVDNHTHLDHIAGVLPPAAPDGEPAGQAWPPSVADHLARAAAAGVDRVVQVGCDLP